MNSSGRALPPISAWWSSLPLSGSAQVPQLFFFSSLRAAAERLFMSRRTLLYLIVFAALQIVPAAHALTLRVQKDAVIATGVTPGGNAVFFAVLYDPASSMPERVRKATILTDEDGDGLVRLSMPGGVPPLGVWAVVDMATGSSKLGSMRGYDITPFDEAVEPSFKGDVRGRFSRLEREMSEAELLVVRPGQGAWTLRGTEGSREDDDPEPNGKLVLSFSKLVSLTADDRPPEALLPGDVVVLINTGDMRAFAGTLPNER
jgi:hypothetical protein